VRVGRISGGNRAAALRCCGSPGGGEGKSTEGGARLDLEGHARLHWKKDKGKRTAGHRMGRRCRRVGQSGVAAVQGLCPTWKEERRPAQALRAVGGRGAQHVERGAEGTVWRPGGAAPAAEQRGNRVEEVVAPGGRKGKELN
jgi:hypothetical protein